MTVWSPAVVLLVSALASISTGCNNHKALLDVARAEFHERWAAKRLHEIYVNGDMAKEKVVGEAEYLVNWERIWRDLGIFQADMKQVRSVEEKGSESIHVTQYYNCRYTRWPVVEEFHWNISDKRAYLRAFVPHPNAEMRCEQGFFSPKCQVVQLGPVPASPALGEPVWSLRKDHDTMTCELQSHDKFGWEMQLYRNGELQSGRRFATHAEAMQYATALRGNVERPGWTAVGEGTK